MTEKLGHKSFTDLIVSVLVTKEHLQYETFNGVALLQQPMKHSKQPTAVVKTSFSSVALHLIMLHA